MNSIIDILNLVDADIEITDSVCTDNTLTIFISKKDSEHFCPLCGHILHSKGSSVRTINHPILQDGRKVVLMLKKRKWQCSRNPQCPHFESDSFSFAPAYQHSTTLVPVMIASELKNLNTTLKDVAERFNVSDTFVHSTFMRYVDMKRLPLSEVISVDEVYMNFDYNHKYPMVIIDFITGETIDILKSRRKEDVESYFLHIPLEERSKVKYLVCDMYNPYVQFTKSYFPNAKAVVDCFHVTQWITHRLDLYIYHIKKKYLQRDKKQLEEKNNYRNIPIKEVPLSKEVYLLTRHKWVLLKNEVNIDYTTPSHYDKHLERVMDTQSYQKLFMELDDKFQTYKSLRDLYFDFNESSCLSQDRIGEELDRLIDVYMNCGEDMFIEFAALLRRYRTEIIRSYTFVEVTLKDGSKETRRLSNAYIESFNNKPKLLKRVSRGLENFDYFRNRLLWATRSDSSMLAIPKSEKEIRGKRNHRGNYKNKK